MMAAYMKWRPVVLCALTMIAIAFVTATIAVDHPRYGWIAGWLGMWFYVRIERLIERAP